MLGWLKDIFVSGSRRCTLRAVHAPHRVRARYDAAATTEENRRHWANADMLSANTANSPEVRRTLRSRARSEVANNSYARGIVGTLANDCVGTGPRLQRLCDDAKVNRLVEQEFAAWADNGTEFKRVQSAVHGRAPLSAPVRLARNEDAPCERGAGRAEDHART